MALGLTGRSIPSVRFIRYALPLQNLLPANALTADFETKVLRGTACAQAMEKLRAEGFTPDTVVAHPGWGEAMFCKDVWPQTRIVAFAEFYYSTQGSDYNFDPEFAKDHLSGRMRLRMKNSVHLHAFRDADAIYSPTEWQRSQIPPEFHFKSHVIFDGIDTTLVRPDRNAVIHLTRNKLLLTPEDEILTFVNRNLEPYRGFHIFMRALPHILKERPNARCLMVGGDETSYGTSHHSGKSWRRVLMEEVGQRLPMERVHFLGRLQYQDYLRVLQVSTCHVYLTYPFVLSWSCLEAMSAGCTLVASNTQPVQEVITHGENGLLVDFFDVAALANQVVQVLQNREKYARLGLHARETILQKYDLVTCCLPRLEALLTP